MLLNADLVLVGVINGLHHQAAVTMGLIESKRERKGSNVFLETLKSHGREFDSFKITKVFDHHTELLNEEGEA